MITSRFPLGDVSFTAGYFSTLVGEATKHCYGVAAMAPRDMTDAVRSLVHGSDYSEKGVRVTQENGRLVIELHIAVSYGLNISTAARSISHRVKDEVEQATGLKVARVVVSVDSCALLGAASPPAIMASPWNTLPMPSKMTIMP